MMLFGEHAVLRGHPALVCAINRRVHVTLTPREDREVHITSALGRVDATVETLAQQDPLRFVTAAVALRKAQLPGGFDLAIQSDIHHKAGLGSSAAVTVATLGALAQWLDGQADLAEVLNQSVDAIRAVQGMGSGADAAASTLGGIVFYQTDPPLARKLNAVHAITIVYSGGKKPTAEVVRLVNEARERHPAIFDAIFELMGRCTQEAAAAIERGDWPAVGRLMNVHQGLMDAIGVCDGKLAGIVYALRKAPGVLGAKISGSGLGDCVIGLGGARAEAFSYDQLPTAMATEGLRIEADAPPIEEVGTT
jgi:mevalonate kinase